MHGLIWLSQALVHFHPYNKPMTQAACHIFVHPASQTGLSPPPPAPPPIQPLAEQCPPAFSYRGTCGKGAHLHGTLKQSVLEHLDKAWWKIHIYKRLQETENTYIVEAIKYWICTPLTNKSILIFNEKLKLAFLNKASLFIGHVYWGLACIQWNEEILSVLFWSFLTCEHISSHIKTSRRRTFLSPWKVPLCLLCQCLGTRSSHLIWKILPVLDLHTNEIIQ